MRRILRSTALLSGGSVLAILTGLITGKLSALWLGPRGVGILGDFRSTMVFAGLVLGLGMATAITRLGSIALADHDEMAFSALTGAALGTALLTVALAAGIVVLWHGPITRTLYGAKSFSSPVLIWLLLSVLGNLLAGIESGILRARLAYIKTLAGASVLNVTLGFGFSIMGLSTHNVNWMLPVYVVTAWAHTLALAVLIRRGQLIHHRWLGLSKLIAAARRLYRFGVPYTLSILVNGGVQALMPAVILHWAGARILGFYMAAITVSTQYLGFLTNSMVQDYLPRLSAESDPRRIEQSIVEELTVVLFLILPLISIVMMVAPIVVPLVYTASFKPAVSLVQWMTAADIFRFGSWCLTYAVLAKARAHFYLLLELIAGSTTILFNWLGFHIGGLAGLGWAYFLVYIVLSIASLIVGLHTLPIRRAAFPKLTIAVSVGTVVLMRLLTFWGLTPITITAMTLLVSVTVVRSYKHLAQGWNRPVPANSTTP